MRKAMALLLAAAACDSAPAPTQVVSAAPTASAAASSTIIAKVIVSGDGKERGVALRAGSAVLLKNVLPEELSDRSRWKYLIAHAEDGRTFTIKGWAKHYDGFKVVLHIDDSDRPALSVYMQTVAGTETRAPGAKPRGFFGGVKKVEVTSTLPQPAAGPALKVKVGGELKELAAAQLAALPMVKKGGRASWRLRDLAGLAAPLKDIASVTLIAGDERVEIAGDDVSSDSVILRTNRTGLLTADIRIPGEDRKRLRGVELTIQLAR